MSLVKLKGKGQMTLPAEIRHKLDLDQGDMLEAKVQRGRIILSPKSVVDRNDVLSAIREGIDAYKAGDVTPAFENVEEFEAYRKTEEYRKFLESK